jgi:hypothetical protein
LGIEGNHDELSECSGSGVRPLELTIPTFLPRRLPALAFCVVCLDDPRFCHAATGVYAMTFVFPIPGRAAFLRSEQKTTSFLTARGGQMRCMIAIFIR